MSTPRIVTIGGGSGAPVVVRALVQTGFTDICAITAATDTGGRTGIVRSDERDRVISVSDLLRNLLALIPPRKLARKQIRAFTDLISFTDGRNRNLGYTIYYALLEKYDNDFPAVQKHLENLLQIKFSGLAIPVTDKPANICFSTQTGATFVGEHELDRQSLSTNTITRIWLDHPVTATKQALAAIDQANWIIFCPGSLYGSVLSNFLPRGATAALKSSAARKILITNLISDRNQTHNFTPADYLQIFQKYTRLKKPFDYIISPRTKTLDFLGAHPQIASNYATEHSHFLGWTPNHFKSLTQTGIRPVLSDTFSVTTHLHRIRHDPVKLAPVLKKIIQNNN